MNLMRYLALVLAALALNANAAPPVMVSGLGVSDCGEWVKKVYAGDPAWVYGYLSALNAEWTYQGAPDFLKGVSGSQVNVWIDNYCQAHPLESVQIGTYMLAQELLNRARARR